MKRTIVLVVVLALLLAACAPKATPTSMAFFWKPFQSSTVIKG